MKNLEVLLIALLFTSCSIALNSCKLVAIVQDEVTASKSDTEHVSETRKTGETREFSEIVPAFAGSEAHFDDKIGFEEYYLVESVDSVKTLTGIIRRQFYSAPDGRSPFEIYRYYQQTIEEMKGEIIFQTRDPLSIEINGESFVSYYNKEKVDEVARLGVSWDYRAFNGVISEYIAAKISQDGTDVYYAITSGRIPSGPYYRLDVVFEVVTVVIE